MYITVKKGYTTNTTNTQNLIDSIFDNPDIPIETLTELYPDTSNSYTENTMRTKTYVIDENDTDTLAKMNIDEPNMLHMAKGIIHEIANIDVNEIPNQYYTFKIPKKTHGFREINAPKPELKERQKKILNILQYHLGIQTHDSAWAYTKNRNIIGAMQEHTNNKSKWYLKIDLKDFFGSCNPEFIQNQLMQIYPFGIKLPTETIQDIIKIACLDNKLPQGTPLSPYLTNLIMVPIDYKINKLLNSLSKSEIINKQRYVYTRYADDIIISAKTKFDIQIIIECIEQLLEGTPLKINREKTRFGSNSGRNWNLGVMCNKDNNITIGYRKKQNIKAIVHNYNKDKTNWTLHDLQYLLGQLSWLENVEPDYAQKLYNYFITKYQYAIKEDITNRIRNKEYIQEDI